MVGVSLSLCFLARAIMQLWWRKRMPKSVFTGRAAQMMTPLNILNKSNHCGIRCMLSIISCWRRTCYRHWSYRHGFVSHTWVSSRWWLISAPIAALIAGVVTPRTTIGVLLPSCWYSALWDISVGDGPLTIWKSQQVAREVHHIFFHCFIYNRSTVLYHKYVQTPVHFSVPGHMAFSGRLQQWLRKKERTNVNVFAWFEWVMILRDYIWMCVCADI